jgi:hypothetical protein
MEAGTEIQTKTTNTPRRYGDSKENSREHDIDVNETRSIPDQTLVLILVSCVLVMDDLIITKRRGSFGEDGEGRQAQ